MVLFGSIENWNYREVDINKNIAPKKITIIFFLSIINFGRIKEMSQ